MEPELVEELFTHVKDKELFPVRVPLFTGTRDYDPVDLMAVFQRNDGVIVLFRMSWDSSWNTIQSVNVHEEYPNLKELFTKYPDYMELIGSPVPTVCNLQHFPKEEPLKIIKLNGFLDRMIDVLRLW